uniref:Uncharacterized protein n=1 Tax=Anguilla anguilla TaxID=7936 RepID=A0A0E9VFQ8_ANGAN
MLAISKMY